MCRSSDPMLVHETSLLELQAAIFNDTAFLAASNHMDYSLVVGIDATKQQLHVGIIGATSLLYPVFAADEAPVRLLDALRLQQKVRRLVLNWSLSLTRHGCRLETLVKEFGGTSKEAPTVVTPPLYKNRFRAASARSLLETSLAHLTDDSVVARYFTLSPDKFLATWKPYLLKTDPTRDVPDPKSDTKLGAETFVTLPRLNVF